MTRAEEIAYEYAKEHGILGYDYDQIYDAVKYGYEQAISDITMLALGEKMKQGVDVSKATEAIKGIDLSSIVNAINANCKELSKNSNVNNE